MLSYDAYDDIYDELQDADKTPFITSDPTLTIWFLHKRVKGKRRRLAKFICIITIDCSVSYHIHEILPDDCTIMFFLTFDDAQKFAIGKILDILRFFTRGQNHRYANIYKTATIDNVTLEFGYLDFAGCNFRLELSLCGIDVKIHALQDTRRITETHHEIIVRKTTDHNYIDNVVLRNDELILKMASTLLMDDYCCQILIDDRYRTIICSVSFPEAIDIIKNELRKMISIDGNFDFDFDMDVKDGELIKFDDASHIISKKYGHIIPLKKFISNHRMTARVIRMEVKN